MQEAKQGSLFLFQEQNAVMCPVASGHCVDEGLRTNHFSSLAVSSTY